MKNNPRKMSKLEEPVDPQTFPGCPYLGIKDDPETRFSGPSSGNYCHRVDPSQPVVPTHQEAFCLTDMYHVCVVFPDNWKGPFPGNLRGNGPTGSRASRKQVPIFQKQKSKKEPPPPVDNFLGNLDVETPEPGTSPLPESDLLAQLHEEARTRYDDTPRSDDRVRWIILLAIASMVLVISIWGVLQRYRGMQVQAAQLSNTAQAVALATSVASTSEVISASQTAQSIALAGSQTAAAASPTPNSTEVAFISQQLSPTAPPTEDPTQAAVATANTCLTESSFPYEIVSGPLLSPPPGHTYIIGWNQPSVQASWVVKNTGPCDWRALVVKPLPTGEPITPLLRVNGEDFVLDSSSFAKIAQGQEVEIVLGFRASTSKNVDREWTLVVNDITLASSPHLVLQVENWITGIQPTKTQPVEATKKPNRPTRTPESGATSEPATPPPVRP